MDYESIFSLLALIALENVLGADNDIFISLTSEKLPARKKKLARLIGISLAVLFRILLLLAVNTLLGTEQTLFSIGDFSFSWKSMILIGGGILLIYSSTIEIYRVTEVQKKESKQREIVSFIKVLLQITLISLLFSVETIITAVAIAQSDWVMYTGVGVGILLMLILSVNIHKVLTAHPSLRVLAFCFLFLIGFSLICDGLEMEVPKQFIYLIMVFAVVVNLTQLKLNGRKIKSGH